MEFEHRSKAIPPGANGQIREVTAQDRPLRVMTWLEGDFWHSAWQRADEQNWHGSRTRFPNEDSAFRHALASAKHHRPAGSDGKPRGKRLPQLSLPVKEQWEQATRDLREAQEKLEAFPHKGEPAELPLIEDICKKHIIVDRLASQILRHSAPRRRVPPGRNALAALEGQTPEASASIDFMIPDAPDVQH